MGGGPERRGESGSWGTKRNGSRAEDSPRSSTRTQQLEPLQDPRRTESLPGASGEARKRRGQGPIWAGPRGESPSQEGPNQAEPVG